MTAQKTTSAKIRAELSHPIIDSDGHFVELAPILNDELLSYIEEIGDSSIRERYLAGAAKPYDTTTALEGRGDEVVRDEWRAKPSWWGWQCRNTLDRATMHLPRLLHERLDEMGMDYAILYPSMTLSFLDLMDGEVASVVTRAVNRMHARMFAPYADRLTIGALIPMHDPNAACADLRYAVEELGLKSAVVAGTTRRPIPRIHRENPELSSVAYRLDTYAVDGEDTYDPFWQTCVDIGIAPVSHSGLRMHRITRSITNYVYNHIGSFGSSHESFCKSLFLGGVTHRFPELRVGFLEGGVAWACSLYADLIGHWEKRNINEIGQLDPSALDVDGVMKLLEEYGDEQVQEHAKSIREYLSEVGPRPDQLDEFSRVGIEKREDIRDKFVNRFTFGCEADDPLVAWAFNDRVNPLGARLHPMFGSDISHWDVPDMTEPVEEAFELVEDGLIGEADFREFTFLNVVRLHAAANPRFFDGTVVQSKVEEVLASGEAE